MAKKQAEAEAPNEEREFAREQIAEVVEAITKSNTQLLSAIKSLPTKFPEFPQIPEAKDNSKAIVDAIKAIEIPVDDDSDVISVLKSLESQNVTMLKAIKALDVRPEVKVDAPILNVPETDFKPVIKAIEKATPEPTVIDFSALEKLMRDSIKASESVKTAITNLRFPVANTPTDPLIYYLPADIDDAGTVQYFGYTDNKGAWYIRQFDTSVSPKTIRFSFGQTNYLTNWSGRAGLTYKVWGS